jgi:hypothetical protein
LTTCPQPGRYIVHRVPNGVMHFYPVYSLVWQGREYRLEWHPFCGPVRLKKNGEPYARQPGERHPFWAGIQAWISHGLHADAEGRCLVAPIPEEKS